MVFDTYDAGDNLPAVRTKLNANAARGTALETGLTNAESATTALTSRVATLEAAPAAATAATLLTGDDANRTARDLGADFDPDTIADSLIGTTFINGGSAVEDKYPLGAGLYTLVTTRSGAGGSTAGRLLTQLAWTQARAYMRTKFDAGAWISWREVGSLGGQVYERLILTGQWVGPDGNGDYTLAIPASEHGLGRRVQIGQVTRTVGADNEHVDSSLASVVELTGDITLRVTATPDNRFAGRVTVRGY